MLTLLADLLGGDQLAAQYLLLNLLSKVSHPGCATLSPDPQNGKTNRTMPSIRSSSTVIKEGRQLIRMVSVCEFCRSGGGSGKTSQGRQIVYQKEFRVVGDIVGFCSLKLFIQIQFCVHYTNAACTNPMLLVELQCCTNPTPHLVQVTGRAEPMAVGKLALNLVGCPAAPSPSAPSPLAALLQVALPALLPACHVLPLSLDLLNKAPFVPRKDYVQNR